MIASKLQDINEAEEPEKDYLMIDSDDDDELNDKE